MRPSLYVPVHDGLGALAELGSVPWTVLRQAYGRGVTGDGIHDDVARSLRELAHHPDEAVSDGLYSNVCHQGTVYEATAYAVPFLAAIAAGDVDGSIRQLLTTLLGDIALGASFPTKDGSRAGAYGEGVDVLVRDAPTRCEPRLRRIATVAPELAGLMDAIVAIAVGPKRTTYVALHVALEGDDVDDLDDLLADTGLLDQ